MTTASEEMRRRWAERQAELVRAVAGGGEPPPGFDADRVRAVAKSLIAKRRRAAARSWPEAARAVGSKFVASFHAFAQEHPLPADASPLSDARAFLAWLTARGEGNVAIDACMMDFDLHYRTTALGLTRRRFTFIVRSGLIGWNVPWLGVRWVRWRNGGDGKMLEPVERP